jgi:hypothetical protein
MSKRTIIEPRTLKDKRLKPRRKRAVYIKIVESHLRSLKRREAQAMKW